MAWLTRTYQLLRKIKMFTGVVEVGLFCDMAQAAYFGMEVSVSGIMFIRRLARESAQSCF